MGPAGIHEYDALAAHLRKAPFLRNGLPLEAEHGSTANDKAGACVVHTHVHWVPGMGHSLNEFQGRLPLRPESTLLSIGEDVPYIFARAGAEQFVFDASGLRSQTIRRILCDLLDRDDTDWTQAPRLDWVEETVEAWLGERI